MFCQNIVHMCVELLTFQQYSKIFNYAFIQVILAYHSVRMTGEVGPFTVFIM